jgi:hypothetical protein
MASNFLRGDRDQPFLLPPDLRDWLPAGHLAWFILDVVDHLDLQPFYQAHRDDGHGHPAYDPKTLLAVLLYGYCSGVHSSRQLERRCTEDIAFRVLAGNQTSTTSPSPASAPATSRPWPASWWPRCGCALPPGWSGSAPSPWMAPSWPPTPPTRQPHPRAAPGRGRRDPPPGRRDRPA